MMHGLIYPAPNIGLSSDPEYLKMIRDDMKKWDDKIWLDHGNAFQTVFIGAARVGYDPDFLWAKAREKIAKSSYPNLWITAMGGGIETCSGIPGMINEMMLQSHGDVIRIFPVFPANQKASFYRLRTFGAFLVSSAIENGKIQYVIIESEKGRECNILNPWPDKTVRVFRNRKESKATSGTILRLLTEPGEELTLVPEGKNFEEISCPTQKNRMKVKTFESRVFEMEYSSPMKRRILTVSGRVIPGKVRALTDMSLFGAYHLSLAIISRIIPTNL